MNFSLWSLAAFCCCFALLPLFSEGTSSDDDLPDYLIVGAGGAGLQMALYLKKFGFSYQIIEKNNAVGSHWQSFPRFDELISINKWVRNETQQMRYDWHTLLEAPLRMMDVTEDYFPTGNDWQKYMSYVAKEAGILPHIEFNTEVAKISEGDRPCLFLLDGTERCAKHRIFIGTGLREKKQPLLEALGGIPYSQATREMARRRRVCILGNGNSGFEIAQNVFDIADRVVLFGKNAHRLSSVTRYTGDVRVKYLQVLENINMKALDTVDYFVGKQVRIEGLEQRLNESQIDVVHSTTLAASWLRDNRCETFFLATGFESNVPEGLTINSRFPETKDWYQSVDNSKVHYIGWLSHGRDFQRSAGGFLHGFRYLIRNLALQVRQEDAGVPYPHLVLTRDEVVAKVVARCQVADDIFILQNGVTVRDVIVPQSDSSYLYYEGITYDFYQELSMRKDVISLYFEWGERSVDTSFEGSVRYSDTGSLKNAYLHPAVEINGLVREVMEDIDLEFIGPYAKAVHTTIQAALAGDLATFRTKQVRPYELITRNQTEFNYYEPVNEKGYVSNDVVQALWKAVYTNGRKKEMDKLRSAVNEWYPDTLALRSKMLLVENKKVMSGTEQAGEMLSSN